LVGFSTLSSFGEFANFEWDPLVSLVECIPTTGRLVGLQTAIVPSSLYSSLLYSLDVHAKLKGCALAATSKTK
jgi:hypothetical protein